MVNNSLFQSGGFSSRLDILVDCNCAREHFKAISGENVVYDVVDSYQALLEKVMR